MVRLPRLLSLIRELRLCPSDPSISMAAAELAQSLYHSKLDHLLENLISTHSFTVATKSQVLPILIHGSLKFTSPLAFEIITHYWVYRMILLNLIYCSANSGPYLVIFDPILITAEEEKIATSIAMAEDYAVETEHPLHAAFCLTLPLLLSFGVWHRYEQRENAECERILNRGTIMKNWSLERANVILGAWRMKGQSIQEMELKSGCFEGGTLLLSLFGPLLCYT